MATKKQHIEIQGFLNYERQVKVHSHKASDLRYALAGRKLNEVQVSATITDRRDLEDLGKILHDSGSSMGQLGAEPQYLQVGDQWRDEEGNEYVLSSCKMQIFHHFGDCAGSDTRFKALLINKETGSTVNATKPEIFLNHGFLENNELTRKQLGITDNMAKIK